MLSLRYRAWLGGITGGSLIVVVGALALQSYIDEKVLERFDRTLLDRHTQLVVALNETTDNPERLRDLLHDPNYSTPYSGRYWQVTDGQGVSYTSASLFDAVLREPLSPQTAYLLRDSLGPDQDKLRVAYQKITFEDGSEWGVSVAESRAELLQERNEMRRGLLLAFAFFGVIGVAMSIVLVSAILTPLTQLRKEVNRRWDEGNDLNPKDYPQEVAPLVEDIAVLLKRNRDIVDRARRQTADLAHALKTPTAILRNELSELAEANVAVDKAQEALVRVDAQLERSLARMRAANSAELAQTRTDLTRSANRLARLFSTMAERQGKSLEIDVSPDLWVRMDPQDIEEVMGNLLDNALKWCSDRMRLRTEVREDCINLVIEDDGPGIPESERREALRSGARLDTSVPGTGLGLAIALDLLKAYGGDLLLEQSAKLGGLAARVVLPTSGGLSAS